MIHKKKELPAEEAKTTKAAAVVVAGEGEVHNPMKKLGARFVKVQKKAAKPEKDKWNKTKAKKGTDEEHVVQRMMIKDVVKEGKAVAEGKTMKAAMAEEGGVKMMKVTTEEGAAKTMINVEMKDVEKEGKAATEGRKMMTNNNDADHPKTEMMTNNNGADHRKTKTTTGKAVAEGEEKKMMKWLIGLMKKQDTNTERTWTIEKFHRDVAAEDRKKKVRANSVTGRIVKPGRNIMIM